MSETATSPHPQFWLADWFVDTGANLLRRGDDEIRLESRVMAVLEYLARHPGELVTREELEREVWGTAVVGYDALTRCIAQLRKVLDDDPRRPRYIETISKKGYRLVARVSATPDAAVGHAAHDHAVGTRRNRWLLAAGLVAVTVALALALLLRTTTEPTAPVPPADRPSIVVLPFTHLGDDPDQVYFSDGVAADINTALSKLSGLYVASHSAALGYRDQSRDVRRAARSLGVRYVLEGSIRRSGNRLRVNANLVDAASNRLLWSEKYDRDLSSVFDVQDDITRNIVNALSVRLTEAERQRSSRRYTTRIEAYDDFLHGQSLYSHHTRQDNRLARDYLNRAIERDPSFARAWGTMALTYVTEHRYGWSSPGSEPLDDALRFARRAVALDSELPHAHWALGYVNLFRRNYPEAAKAARRAVELDPSFADSYLTLAVCEMNLGAADKALPLIRKAMQLSPEYPAAYVSLLGQAHYLLGEYELAVPVLREAVERNVNLRTPQLFLVAALVRLDRLEEAGWAAEHLRVTAPEFGLDQVAGLLPVQDPKVVADITEQLRKTGF